MGQSLNTPQVKTQTVTEVEITCITVDYERNETIIAYMTKLDNGTPHQRGRIKDEGTDMLNNTSIYARVISSIEQE